MIMLVKFVGFFSYRVYISSIYFQREIPTIPIVYIGTSQFRVHPCVISRKYNYYTEQNKNIPLALCPLPLSRLRPLPLWLLRRPPVNVKFLSHDAKDHGRIGTLVNVLEWLRICDCGGSNCDHYQFAEVDLRKIFILKVLKEVISRNILRRVDIQRSIS